MLRVLYAIVRLSSGKTISSARITFFRRPRISYYVLPEFPGISNVFDFSRQLRLRRHRRPIAYYANSCASFHQVLIGDLVGSLNSILVLGDAAYQQLWIHVIKLMELYGRLNHVLHCVNQKLGMSQTSLKCIVCLPTTWMGSFCHFVTWTLSRCATRQPIL